MERGRKEQRWTRREEKARQEDVRDIAATMKTIETREHAANAGYLGQSPYVLREMKCAYCTFGRAARVQVDTQGASKCA